MNNDNNKEDDHSRKILDYLSGKMDEAERRAFDEELSRNDELKEILADFRFAETGAAIFDRIESGHISSELLLTYSENPQSLDKKDITAIEKHLKICKQCREDLEFCRHDLPAQTDMETEGIWKNLFLAISYLFKPQPAFRPVYGLALVLAIVIPAFIFYPGGDFDKGYISSFNIQPGTRDIGTVNNIVISPVDRFIELSFTIPVIEDRYYIINLFNSDSLPVLTGYEYNPDDQFEIDIPVSYLSEGNNYIVVGEFEGDIEQDRFNFIFTVRYQK